MDLSADKIDGVYLPVSNRRISASEWNQLVASCMAFLTEAGLTPDATDDDQLLNAVKTIVTSMGHEGANTNLSNLSVTGEAHFAKPDFSNVTKPYVTETYSNGTSWYRVWSDGWCEQGGVANRSSSSEIELLVTMADDNYSISMFSKSGHVYAYQNQSNTTTGFKFNTAYDSGDANTGTFYWVVKGYKATGA